MSSQELQTKEVRSAHLKALYIHVLNITIQRKDAPDFSFNATLRSDLVPDSKDQKDTGKIINSISDTDVMSVWDLDSKKARALRPQEIKKSVIVDEAPFLAAKAAEPDGNTAASS